MSKVEIAGAYWSLLSIGPQPGLYFFQNRAAVYEYRYASGILAAKSVKINYPYSTWYNERQTKPFQQGEKY